MAQPQMRKPVEYFLDNKKFLHPKLAANYGNWKYHDRPRPGVLHHVSKTGDEVWTVRAGTARQMDVFTIRKLCDIADRFAEGRVRFTIRSNIEFILSEEGKVAPLIAELEKNGFPVGGTGNSVSMVAHTQGWLHCDIPGTDASGVVKSMMDALFDDFKNEGVVASSSWPFQVNLLQFDKQPVASTIPEEGATGWADTTMMATDAPHPNCAYLWLNQSLNPKLQGDLAAWFGSVPSVPAACKGNELLGAEGCRPITQPEQVTAGWPQGSVLLGQERQPEAHSILRQPKRDLVLVLPPHRDRWPVKATVDRLMVSAHNVESDVALALPQSQCRMPLVVVVA